MKASFKILEDINNIPDGLNISDVFDTRKINVAKILTGDAKSFVYLDNNDNTLISTLQDDKKTSSYDDEENDDKTRFELVIPYRVERWVGYIYGKAGQGKSLLASQLALQYKILNPKNKVFYVCSTEMAHDRNWRELDFVKPINANDIYSLDMTQDDEREMIEKLLSNSLVVFDDLDMAKNKKLITALQFKLIEVGRKYGVSVLIITHVNCGGHQTKMILNELDMYFCFKNGLKNNRLLETYNGYKKDDLERIKTKSWVCFNFRYNVIVTPHMVEKI